MSQELWSAVDRYIAEVSVPSKAALDAGDRGLVQADEAAADQAIWYRYLQK